MTLQQDDRLNRDDYRTEMAFRMLFELAIDPDLEASYYAMAHEHYGIRNKHI